MERFNIKKFLTENKLTDQSKRLDEASVPTFNIKAPTLFDDHLVGYEDTSHSLSNAKKFPFDKAKLMAIAKLPYGEEWKFYDYKNDVYVSGSINPQIVGKLIYNGGNEKRKVMKTLKHFSKAS